MDKQVQFLGKTEQGIFAQALFGSAGAFEKVAGAPPFADWATGDSLRRYIRTITQEDRRKYCYVLVNALGAGEFFGSNINADYFPWNSLAHEGDDYGYKTFYAAHAYQHHANKDPQRAFGVPVLSTLNIPMKRVELIIRLDREKARVEQADGIITRIDRGEFPDVSMGCKVPYDVCSICGQRSKTRYDYCEHMRPPEALRGVYGPNKILPDGRRIYVINLTPRFFDISFVFIGADKTAKVMAKLASKGGQLCLGDVCAIPRPSAEVYELVDFRGEKIDLTEHAKTASVSVQKTKHASSQICGPCGRRCAECEKQPSCHAEKLAEAFHVKTSSHKKLSEIIKNVPAGTFALRHLPQLERNEPDIPTELLDQLSNKSVGETCGSLSSLGVVLKPHEFQKIVLRRMGDADLAEHLHRKHHVFRQVADFDDSMPLSIERDGAEDLARLLRSVLKDRTAFGEPFRVRVIIVKTSQNSLPTRHAVADPLLDKISAAYNGYRRNMLMKLSQAVEVVESDPQLREAVLGESLTDLFTKKASSPIVTLDSVQYLVGAHLTDRSLLTNTAVADAAAILNSQILSGEGCESA